MKILQIFQNTMYMMYNFFSYKFSDSENIGYLYISFFLILGDIHVFPYLFFC